MELKKFRGFTLIELVIVIAIIGILAAVAIPRYISIQNSARAAKLMGAYGSAASAAKLFKAQCLVNGGNCPTVDMDGVNVTGVNQYPTADTTGITAASGISSGDYTITALGGVVTVSVDSPTANSCEFTYTAAAAGSEPAMAIVSQACN